MHWFFNYAPTDSCRVKAEPHHLEYCRFDHMWPLLASQTTTSCIFWMPDYIIKKQMGLKMPKQQTEGINWTIRFSLVAIACTIIIAAVNLPYIIWQKRAYQRWLWVISGNDYTNLLLRLVWYFINRLSIILRTCNWIYSDLSNCCYTWPGESHGQQRLIGFFMDGIWMMGGGSLSSILEWTEILLWLNKCIHAHRY